MLIVVQINNKLTNRNLLKSFPTPETLTEVSMVNRYIIRLSKTIKLIQINEPKETVKAISYGHKNRSKN